MLLRGRRYDTQDCVELEMVDDAIAAIRPLIDDPTLPWLAPGFIDLQVNGYNGIGFNDANLSTEKIEQVSAAMRTFGVTKYLPTCTTDAFEVLESSFRMLAQACNESKRLQQQIPGFHLEGPYISPQDGARGAHPPKHVRPPNWTEFQSLQDAANGMIRLITLSPEYAEAPAFIERATQSGVVVAIGHTSATSDQIQVAVDSGAKLSTHLGNGAHPVLKRHPNYIWDQLAEDRLMASLIVDGHHLAPAVVKTMIRAKTPQRCILISDLTNLAGQPPGRYESPLGDVEVLQNGKLVVAGQSEIMAGASVPLFEAIANAMRFAGVELQTAIELVTVNPARLMGWEEPKLEVGFKAGVVCFDLNHAGHIKLVPPNLPTNRPPPA